MNASIRYARILFLATNLLVACGATAQANGDNPERGGTNLNPFWIYKPQAILAVNPGTGTIQSNALRITKAERSGFLNGPVTKLCQPLFNGTGVASSMIRLNTTLLQAGRNAEEPMITVQLTAKDRDTGAPIVDITHYRAEDLFDGEWLTANNSIDIEAGATNVCLSVYVYPLTVLVGGQANPYIQELWTSSARIQMNSNAIQE